MRRFIIEKTNADLTSHAGLALVGMALNQHSGLEERVDRQVALRHGIAHSDVLQLDTDVRPFDNSGTEGDSRTYQGHDGYAPMATYLGRKCYCLEFELRVGKQHC